jgi:hypothetical protein
MLLNARVSTMTIDEEFIGILVRLDLLVVKIVEDVVVMEEDAPKPILFISISVVVDKDDVSAIFVFKLELEIKIVDGSRVVAEAVLVYMFNDASGVFLENEDETTVVIVSAEEPPGFIVKIGAAIEFCAETLIAE